MADETATASAAYATAQLNRALQTLSEHPDPAVRARALDRIRRWQSVMAGMTTGDLTIGARTPVKDIPAWATLEVVHGGFATGQLSAELPLDEEEQALVASLPAGQAGESDRGRCNRYALSPAGQAALLARIEDGRFRVELPEEGALAVVACLMARGAVEPAMAVIEEIAPYFDRLRFTPRASDQPLSAGLSVFRQPIAQVAEELRTRGGSKQVAAMNETLRVWIPLTDEAAALLLETVDGEAPHVLTDTQGQALAGPDGQPLLGGGAPLALRPEGWEPRARAFLSRLDEAQARHTQCARPRKARSSLGVLSAAIRVALDPDRPLPRPAASVKRVLAGGAFRRGAPGSEQLRPLRQAQAAAAAVPGNLELSRLLADRLAKLPVEGGLPSLDAVGGPVLAAELPAAEGMALPRSLLAKATRCLEAPVEELVALGVVPSAEVLAELLPQITAQVVAASMEDPVLRRLFAAIYGAFRRRRTLLLLNLERQVRLDELPWIRALSAFRLTSLDAKLQARQTLEQVSTLAFASFPQTILPNPLISEMLSLSKAAGLALPLVEELAADIFMGTFTAKFQRAAQTASTLLQDGLYARYYDLPLASDYAALPLRKFGTGEKTREIADVFAAICKARAGLPHGTLVHRSVAANGVVLEQAQILNTHNLAVLFSALGLAKSMSEQLVPMAQRCLAWILRRSAMLVTDRAAKLQLVKNSAYAWRQMIFFLSLAPVEAQRVFLAQARASFEASAKDTPRLARLRPALIGLEAVARSQRFDADGRLGAGRRFLGWTLWPHWFFAEN